MKKFFICKFNDLRINKPYKIHNNELVFFYKNKKYMLIQVSAHTLEAHYLSMTINFIVIGMAINLTILENAFHTI